MATKLTYQQASRNHQAALDEMAAKLCLEDHTEDDCELAMRNATYMYDDDGRLWMGWPEGPAYPPQWVLGDDGNWMEPDADHLAALGQLVAAL